jgi:hypothetical protein
MGQGDINDGDKTKRMRKMGKSDEQLEAQDRKRESSAARKLLPGNKRPGGSVADWHNATPEQIHRLICAVTVAGGAVRFGYTRDGGAYSIGLYLGEDSKTYYCNEAEGIDEQLQELTDHFTG